MNNVVIGSGAQQSGSAIRIPISVLLPIPLSSRLPYYIEQTSMCYTVSLCWLHMLNIAVCTCPSQTP